MQKRERRALAWLLFWCAWGAYDLFVLWAGFYAVGSWIWWLLLVMAFAVLVIILCALDEYFTVRANRPEPMDERW